MARVTGLEPATSGVTGRHSNRLSYTRAADAAKPIGPRRGGELSTKPGRVKRTKRWPSKHFRQPRPPAERCAPARARSWRPVALRVRELTCRAGAKCVNGLPWRRPAAAKAGICRPVQRSGQAIRPWRAISSVGRALRLHRRCRRFEPVIAHQPFQGLGRLLRSKPQGRRALGKASIARATDIADQGRPTPGPAVCPGSVDWRRTSAFRLYRPSGCACSRDWRRCLGRRSLRPGPAPAHGERHRRGPFAAHCRPLPPAGRGCSRRGTDFFCCPIEQPATLQR